MTATPTLLKGIVPGYYDSKPLDVEFYIKDIDKDAIIKVIEQERDQGTLACSVLVGKRLNIQTGEYPEFVEDASCSDFFKCVMGALLCAAGYSVVAVNEIAADVASWKMKEYRAMWEKFGLTPWQCVSLMRTNDQYNTTDARAAMLIGKVKSMRSMPMSSSFFDFDIYKDDSYGSVFTSGLNGLPQMPSSSIEQLRYIATEQGLLSKEIVTNA